MAWPATSPSSGTGPVTPTTPAAWPALHDPQQPDLAAGAAGLLTTNGSFPNWNGPYLPSIPLDPWGNNYFFDSDYLVNGHNRVVIGSFGPNGVGPNVYDSDDVIKIIY